jgi:large subunit ribosomal protein L10
MAVKYGKKVRELMIRDMDKLFINKNGFVFAQFGNIKAGEMAEFRKKVTKAGSKFFVLKKRLGRVSLEKAGYSELVVVLKDKKNVGVAAVVADPAAIIKIFMEFAKKNEKFVVASGCLEGRVIGSEQIKAIANLPPREQLIAMAIGNMKSPITGFVGVLASVLRSVCTVLNAIKDKKESGN